MQNPSKKGRSIFSIILLAFMLAVIPVYAAGYVIYQWGIARIRNEITSSQAAQTSYYMEKFHSDIQRIIKQQSGLANDKDVIRLSAFGEEDTGKSGTNIEAMLLINRIQTRLAAIMDSSDIIKNASLHIPSIKRSIHAVGSISNMTAQAYLDLKKISDRNEGQVLFRNDVPITMVASRSTYTEGGSLPAYIVEVELSSGSIRDALGRMKGNSDGGIALIDKKLGVFIAGIGDRDTVWELLQSHKTGSAGVNRVTADPAAAAKAYEGNEYLLALSEDAFTGLTLVNYTPVREIYQPLQNYQLYFWLFTLVVAVMAVLFLFFMYGQIKRPLVKLVNAFETVENGNFDVSIAYRSSNEFKHLYSSFNSMIGRIKNLIDQVYLQKILYQKSELKQLQSQINPHFLYNSYFVLYDMATSQDCEGLAEYARQMGTYFQYITRNARQTVTLREEVEHACIYANFQARRFRNRIAVLLEELPEGLHGQKVPKVILQPLLENAFEHGLKNKVKDGILKLSYQDHGLFFSIYVEDNGDEAGDDVLEKLQNELSSEDKEMECTGIVNIHRRIRLSFGAGSGIFVTRSSLGGVMVEMRIEKAREGNHVQIAGCGR